MKRLLLIALLATPLAACVPPPSNDHVPAACQVAGTWCGPAILDREQMLAPTTTTVDVPVSVPRNETSEAN